MESNNRQAGTRYLLPALSGEVAKPRLAQVTNVVPFAELPNVFPFMLQGKHRGRTVVEMPVLRDKL